MPIFLPQPQPAPRGPDGRGWNRLRIETLGGDECALKPTSYPTLVESQDTRRARYGGFGPCARSGACGDCPVLNGEPWELHALTDRVFVWVDDNGRPWLVNRPGDPASQCHRVTWAKLARIAGWTVGRAEYIKAHGQGFWLERV